MLAMGTMAGVGVGVGFGSKRPAPRYPSSITGILEYADGADLPAPSVQGNVSSLVGRIAGTVFAQATAGWRPSSTEVYHGGKRALRIEPGTPGRGLVAATKLGIANEYALYVDVEFISIEDVDSRNIVASIGDVGDISAAHGIRYSSAFGNKPYLSIATAGAAYSTGTVLSIQRHTLIWAVDASGNYRWRDGAADHPTGGEATIKIASALSAYMSIGGGGHRPNGGAYYGANCAIRKIAWSNKKPTSGDVSAWEAWCAA
jgi:hypothetical protein